MTDWIAHILVIATGFGTVLAVLTMLWGACAVIGISFARRGAPSGRTNPAALLAGAGDGVPAEHVAAISAAVSAVVKAPHSIIRITAPCHSPSGWRLEGQFDSFGTQRMPWDRWPRVTAKSRRRKNR
jgi:Na+-transporting methylmalonyl-CoA/oxaloacetate decarboxylase gamma subunit